MTKKSNEVTTNKVPLDASVSNIEGEPLQSYFDQEVNKILNKINNFSGSLNKSQNVEPVEV